jgi:hypothetical protein
MCICELDGSINLGYHFTVVTDLALLHEIIDTDITLYETSTVRIRTGYEIRVQEIFVLLVIMTSNYRSSLDTWTVVQMTDAKFKSLIFSVWGFAFSNIAYIFILIIMNDFCLSSA